MIIINSQLVKFFNFNIYKFISCIFLILFTSNVALSKSAPDSFAELAKPARPAKPAKLLLLLSRQRKQCDVDHYCASLRVLEAAMDLFAFWEC